MSRLTKLWSGNPLSELEHVGLGRQLLFNVFMEDLPQFILTGVTKPTSVTGVLNITTSGLSLVSKIVRGCSMKGEPSLATQFDMIEQDPAFTQNMFRLRDDAKKKAERAERLVNLAWTNRYIVFSISSASGMNSRKYFRFDKKLQSNGSDSHAQGEA